MNEKKWKDSFFSHENNGRNIAGAFCSAPIVFMLFADEATGVQSAIPLIALRLYFTYDLGVLCVPQGCSWVGFADNTVFE